MHIVAIAVFALHCFYFIFSCLLVCLLVGLWYRVGIYGTKIRYNMIRWDISTCAQKLTKWPA